MTRGDVDPGNGRQLVGHEAHLELGGDAVLVGQLVFPEAGHYPFVNHVMVDAERGAHGVFEVSE